MNILISNDDGVLAPGLQALYEALLQLSAVQSVKVVAPDSEFSGSGAALSITRALYTQTLSSGFVAVRGTPADCVFLALNHLYADIAFDCVITGINAGANLGRDVLYSGTFGAAAVAKQFGRVSVATSLVGAAVKGHQSSDDYQVAARHIAKLLSHDMLAVLGKLPDCVLNVNVPDQPDIHGYRVTQLAHQTLAEPVHCLIDPRQQSMYWLSLKKQATGQRQQGSSNHTSHIEDLSHIHHHDSELGIPADVVSDVAAVSAGYISVCPVSLPRSCSAASQQLHDLLRQ